MSAKAKAVAAAAAAAALSAAAAARNSLTCAVCTEPFVLPIALGCGHVFCAACVFKQAEMGSAAANKCALCKFEFADTSVVAGAAKAATRNAAQEFVMQARPIRPLIAAVEALCDEGEVADGVDAIAALFTLVPFRARAAGAGARVDALLAVVGEKLELFARAVKPAAKAVAAKKRLAELRDALDGEDGGGRTLLWWAAQSGDNAVAFKLLDLGASGEFFENAFLSTPLMQAARRGSHALVRRLVADCAESVDATNRAGKTALEIAIQARKQLATLVLLKVSPQPTTSTEDDAFVGSALISRKDDLAALWQLREAGDDSADDGSVASEGSGECSDGGDADEGDGEDEDASEYY